MSKKVSNKNRPIKASKNHGANYAVLGEYSGECADANITNENGLDITRPVWENVFNSESFETGLKNGWYIGYLGHPEDPGCQEFQNGCIVMTSGRIDDNGKIYCTFNLLDTPVGRIVKTYIDAGVTFGISVRGAGDIVNNSVDPDTFEFRGFDLVAFPAFPESIPTFSALAASTNLDKQRQYKAICAAINANIDKVNNKDTLNILQKPLAKQSNEYKKIASQISHIDDKNADEPLYDIEDVQNDKLDAVLALYAEQALELDEMKKYTAQLVSEAQQVKCDMRRKLATMNRIISNQLADQEAITASYQSNIRSLKRRNAKQLKTLQAKHRQAIKANAEIKSQNTNLQNDIERLQNSNLKYKQQITANKNILAEQKSQLSELDQELSKTLRKVESQTQVASDLDAQVQQQQQDVTSATRRLDTANDKLAEFQQAYAKLYANAVGRDLSSIKITSSMSLSDVQTAISGEQYTDDNASAYPVGFEDDTNGIVSI